MPIYASFKKDWEKTKDEMEKLGEKKPAEIKTFKVWFVKIEKRVSSGIGDALKGLDSAEPKDTKNPTTKEIEEFRKAFLEARKAIKSEMDLINSEVEKYPKTGEGKVDKASKDGAYRALKVFKSKLEHYQAVANEQLTDYQQAVNTKLDEGGKRVGKFQATTKQKLTKAAATLKQIMADPTLENYEAGVKEIRQTFADIRSEASTIASWFDSKRNADLQEGTFDMLYRSLSNLPNIDNKSTDVDIRAAVSAVSKVVKSGIATLAQVKLPK